MKNRAKYILNSLFVGIFLLGICLQNSGCKDDFTTDPEYKLTMPDSLLFDTIISETISPTAMFKIYNKTEEDIKIASILLVSQLNYFKINVNGKSGTSFSNVELLSGDSLYIFVQIVADASGNDTPLLIEDEIKFMYNGNCQSIVLSAYGQDAHHLRDKVHISSDTVWTNEKPFLVYDSIIVDSSATLTIKEGVTLYMKKKATLLVNGSLHIEGSAGKDVVFRTDRTDNLTTTKSYDQLNDQWGGIRFSSSSQDNRIDHALIKSGAFGIEIDSSEFSEDKYKLIIANSHIHNVHEACLKAYNANVKAYNSLFTNGNNGCVILAGGNYQFDHCTISSYDKGIGEYRYALTLSNSGYLRQDLAEPQYFKARFNNCIVSGENMPKNKPWDEILFSTDTLDYRFDHSLIYTDIKEEDMAMDTNRFNMVISNQDPEFILINKSEKLFDFHLKEDSPCKERGDLGLVIQNEAYQTDRDGFVRDLEAAPDLGALQIVVDVDSSAVNQ